VKIRTPWDDDLVEKKPKRKKKAKKKPARKKAAKKRKAKKKPARKKAKKAKKAKKTKKATRKKECPRCGAGRAKGTPCICSRKAPAKPKKQQTREAVKSAPAHWGSVKGGKEDYFTGLWWKKAGFDPVVDYTYIIRSPEHDPKEPSRTETRGYGKRTAQDWRKELGKGPGTPAARAKWKKRFLKLLKKKGPLTFNAIMLLSTDGKYTADIGFANIPAYALWELVAERDVWHTQAPPVFFEHYSKVKPCSCKKCKGARKPATAALRKEYEAWLEEAA
jgi:hypothetical protein